MALGPSFCHPTLYGRTGIWDVWYSRIPAIRVLRILRVRLISQISSEFLVPHENVRHCSGCPQRLKGRKSSVYKPYDRHIASHIAICHPHLLLILIAITNHQTGSDGLWNLISVQSLKRDLPGLFSILTIWNLGELCLFFVVGAKGSRQIGNKWSLGMRRLWFPITSFPNQLWTSHEEREFWQKKRSRDQLLFTIGATAPL